MDPFSPEGELINLHTAFHTGRFAAVASATTSSLSAANALPARILQLRARIAISPSSAAAVAKELASESSPVDLVAARTLAEHVASPSKDGPKDKALALSQSDGDNLTVQLCCGTILANAGQTAEALALLAKHQGSLDAVALITQIHLAANRLDLAVAELRNARAWAQDSLLVNIAESWAGLRAGGEKYQAAFYVFEELATAPPVPLGGDGEEETAGTAKALLGQAIAELHLGRLPEAEAALGTALERGPDDADVLATAVTLNTILGKDAERQAMLGRLAKANKEHPLLVDAQAKKDLFDSATAKWTPKFEVEA
ncbi:hypothetical protein FH972_021848 [Carpinus fangiana]|uniref:Coatomer subunit epsilon n=1 Tax=Carpinus fangiana TaxID=176857 RepID=A0A5N6KQI1_9ROSI|nr:hypothetical protein FH972_021848 [Carpinus fangiana]